MLSGIIGVPLGSLWSTKWRPKNQRADPLICGTGLALSSIFLCISLFLCNSYFILAFVMIFLGEISLNLNWSIVADILLVSYTYTYTVHTYNILSQNPMKKIYRTNSNNFEIR